MMEQFGDVDRPRYPGAGKGKFTIGRFSLIGIDYSLIGLVRRAAAPAPVINGD